MLSTAKLELGFYKEYKISVLIKNFKPIKQKRNSTTATSLFKSIFKN